MPSSHNSFHHTRYAQDSDSLYSDINISMKRQFISASLVVLKGYTPPSGKHCKM